MSNNNTVPGLIRPTQMGMLKGNQNDSAIQYLTNMNLKQNALAQAVGGRKKGKKGGSIAVHQYRMLYPVQNGPGQDPNSQILKGSMNGTQSAALRTYDDYAKIMTGGYSSMKWGCYSGGKRRASKKRRAKGGRKTRRSRKW